MKTMKFILLLSLIPTMIVAQQKQTAPDISVKAYQQHTMMVVAKLRLPDGVISLNEKDVLYAYINGEARGKAHPFPGVDGAIFLSIADNDDHAKPISFMVWLNERKETFAVNETLFFEPLAAVGELNNPFIFTLGEMVGQDEISDPVWIGKPYPNPFTEKTVVPYRLSASAKLKVKVYNNLGQLLKDYTIHHESKGNYHLELNKETMQQGIYKLLIQVETGQKILTYSKSVVLIN